jgi:hypothetical protein
MITETEPLIEVAPNPDAEEMQGLELFLRNEDGWLTANEILLIKNQPQTESNRRILRALASESIWIVSGQKGYKHIEHATAEEIDHAANWLESQAKKMSVRACALRSNAHKIFG